MRRPKIVTIFGTRPEFIRLSRLVKELDDIAEHFVVNTGQNFDPSLSDVFFDDLKIRQPDLVIDSRAVGLAQSLAAIFTGVEDVLRNFQPDAVLILGDTNSSLSAIVAERLGFPVFHMEAGNRSFDSRVPEELNRKIVDHVSTFNLPYSNYARNNLLREGIHPDSICVTGSPMPEVIKALEPAMSESKVLERHGLTPRGYFIVSAHRQETVDSESELSTLVESISGLANDSARPVLVSAHPRLRSNLERREMALDPKVRVMEPFGLIDYLTLQRNSACVFSDSGSLPEESGYLGFPSVIIRKSFERQESLDGGFVGLAGLDLESWKRALSLRASSSNAEIPVEYKSENFTTKVINFVFSKLASQVRH